MKSLVDLLEDLLLDCGRRSGAPVARDCKTVRERVEHEGDSFITITLPNFCRDFERSLDEGRVSPGLFLSFGKTHSGIPEFLQGFLSRVFGPDAVLLDKPSVDCILYVRQICLFGKKICRPCSTERIDSAIESFAQCDDDIVAPSGESQFYRYFKTVAHVLTRAMELEDSGWEAEISPRHGPGATRERIFGNQKWRFRRWHRRLEDEGISFFLFGRASLTFTSEDLDNWPTIVDPEDEEPVKVTFVPKTLKSPRTIAVEPVCMQYVQQGLMRYLVERLSRCSLTSGHVNFHSQAVNQALAKEASGTGKYATLDMSEASDRVSLAHVTDMLEHAPKFRKWALACRSTRAQLPDGQVIVLKKFASMGSALCFPIESMVFFTSIIASRILRAGLFPDAHTVRAFGRDVYVFGDDLIVPTDEASAICVDLESIGFKVNRHKSFWTGKFRESCGSDCYDNVEVTPVYLRRDLPTSRRDVSGIVSTIATANQLAKAGYTRCATALREAVERILGPLPQVPVDSPALGWHEFSEFRPRRRWNRDLQRVEALCWVPYSPKSPDPLDGDGALAKCFRLIGLTLLKECESPLRKLPKIDPEHLETSPRPYGLALKRRWVPLY